MFMNVICLSVRALTHQNLVNCHVIHIELLRFTMAFSVLKIKRVVSFIDRRTQNNCFTLWPMEEKSFAGYFNDATLFLTYGN